MIPQLPSAEDGKLTMEIAAGDSPLRGLEIDFHHAFVGTPDPRTCQGEAQYAAMRPCERLRVRYIPAGGVMTVNGVTGRVTLSCDGAAPVDADHLMEGWTHPSWSPLCRYWAIARFDCLQTSKNVNIDIEMRPEFSG